MSGARFGASMPGERALRVAAASLALLGIGIATYIAIADAGGGAPACLAGGHGCQTVADSSYSHLAGIPVSAIGIAGYGGLLAAALWPGDPGRFAGLGLAMVGFGFSLYLTYLELFVIDAICQWCVASAVVMAGLLVVTAMRAARYGASELREPPARDAPELELGKRSGS